MLTWVVGGWQVGKSLFLLGKHKGALEVYEEALRLGHTEDWEV
jgi:Bardet-Biedl syndrome 4 protein